MDEPFGALDAQTRAQLQEDLLQQWARSRQTVVFITHDIEEALYLASRVLVMSARPGRFVCELQVPFEYPRQGSIRLSPEFTELKSKAWAAIHS